MSWGTDFTTDIFLTRQSFSNLYELENKIEDNNKLISSIKSRIMMYGSSSPSELIPEDWEEDAINFIAQRIEELFEEYEEVLIENYRLYLYLETKPFKDDK